MTDSNPEQGELVEEDGKYFVVDAHGDRVPMDKEAWDALKTYRGEG